MKLSTPTLASHRAGTRTAILGIALSWVLCAQGAQRFHPDVDAFNLQLGTQTFAGRLPDDAEFAVLTAPLLNSALPGDSSARRGNLEIAIRPGSEAGALNLRSAHCPDDLFDFRTCEGVVVGSTDFGLFQVKLPATFGDGHKSWRRDGNTWSYVWPYAQGITVRVAVEPDGDSLKLHYTLHNTSTQAFDAVQLHTCIPTTEAPGFFPPPTVHHTDTNWSELYQRLHLWSDGRRFTLADTTLAGREPHLSLMRQGAEPVRWAWWVNGPETFDLPIIALTSSDGQKTVALAFEQAIWASANTGDDRACFHLFPWFGRIEPGQSASVRGRFYLLRGGPEEALARFRQHFPGDKTVNWSQFRGPNGAGVAESFRPPVKVALAEAAWKTALPPGSSSPVLWGSRVFVTGVAGNRLVTIGLDATSGEVLWKRLAPETPLERVHDANNAAASTPCADADQVYVYFGSYGLLCYDHDGRERWSKPIPTPQSMYGVATSPILHHDLLLLVRDDDADLPDSRLSRSSVIALDRRTGAPVWETSRPYNRGAWATPMIWNHEWGIDLVVPGNGRVYGYDPATGQEKWYVNGFAREPIAVPIAGDGQLYVSVSMQGGRGDAQLDPEPFWTAMLQFDRNGDQRIGRDEISEYFTLPFRPELPIGHPGFGLPLPQDPASRARRQHELFDWRDKNKDGFWTKDEFTADMSVGHGRPNLAAVLPGGSGDITDSHVTWNLRSGIPEIPSPVFHEGRLYLVRDGGVLSCVAADTGTVLYRERLAAPGQYMASPVIAGGHLYLVSARGVITVVKTGSEFRIVHQTDLNAPVAATPALDSKSLYLRTADALWAFR